MFFRNQPFEIRNYKNIIFKTVVFTLFIWILYHEISQKQQIEHIVQHFIYQLYHSQSGWLWATLVLMPLNWLCETWKWLPLVRKVEPEFSIGQAFKSVLTGVTLSLFTPNRIGDFGGRVLFVQPENKLRTLFATFISSMAQQIVLITFGLAGCCYFIAQFVPLASHWWYGLIWGSVSFTTLLITFFLNIRLFIPLARRLRLLRIRQVLKSAKILKSYSSAELLHALGWATLRYSIYTIQYYLILRFFGIHAPILQGLACIATIYLIQTSIPLPPAFGLLARGEIALKIWSLFPNGDNQLGILAATFTLWMINLILPGCIGLAVLLKTNFFKRTHNNRQNNE